MHGVCTVCVCVCMWVCLGCCVARRAYYTLTGRDRWSEMHDGILWWAGRVWINMVDFNSPCCVCMCVCLMPSDLSVCAVFTEAFYWRPHESFSFSNIQSCPHSILLPSFTDFSASSFPPLPTLFRLHRSFPRISTSLSTVLSAFFHLVSYLLHKLYFSLCCSCFYYLFKFMLSSQKQIWKSTDVRWLKLPLKTWLF